MTKLITAFFICNYFYFSSRQQSVNPATGGQFEQGMGKLSDFGRR
jgi:hypothetical protein